MRRLGHLQLDYRRDGKGRTVALDRQRVRAARAATALPGSAGHHELVHLPGEIVAGDRGLARARMTDLSFLAAKETLGFKSSKQGIRPAGKFDPRISAQDDLHQIQTYE